MRTIIKYIAIICCLYGGITKAQTIGMRFPDSSAVKGNFIDIPVYVDSSLTGRNILSYQLKVSYNGFNADVIAVSNAGTISSGFSAPVFSVNTATGIISITSAGTTPLSGTGVLLYIRLQLKQAGGLYMTFANGVSDNYFNEGLPAMVFKTGYVSVSNPPTITAYFAHNNPLTIGDSVQVYVSGGNAPYTYQAVNPAVASVSATGMLTALAAGRTKVITHSADSLTDTTDNDIEIRALKLSLPDTTILPLPDIIYPVRINSVNSSNVLSGSFRINFSAGYLLPDSILLNNTLLQNANVSYQVFNGYAIISFAAAQPLSGSGDLLKIRFKIQNPQGTYLSLQDILFNQDIPANTQSGYIFYTPVPALNIFPSSADLFVGQTQQFTGAGGKTPYTFSVSDTNPATINAAGLLTVKNGGIIKVNITDSLNATAQTGNIRLYDAALTLPAISVLNSASFVYPVFISEFTGNRPVYSVQFTISYNSNSLDSVDVLLANTLASGWSVTKNVFADKIIIALAGTTPVTTNGLLFKLTGKVNQTVTTGSTIYFSFNDVLFNEGNFYSKNTNGQISVVGSLQNDIGINSIQGISSGCGKSTQEPITASIYNYNNTTYFVGDTLFVGYILNTNAPVFDTIILTTNISQNQSLNYTFKQKANLSAAGSYTLKVFIHLDGDINAANDTNSISFQVYSSPIINLGNDTAICKGVFQLNATYPGAAYLWNNNTTAATLNIDTSGQYWVRLSVNGCDAYDTINITVNPIPTIAKLTGVQYSGVCGLDSISLATPSVIGFKYRWLMNGSNTSNPTDTFNQLLVKTSGTYTVHVTNTEGCSALMPDTTITLATSRQAAPTITGNATACEGDSLSLNASILSNVVYRWSGPNGFTATTQNINITNITSNHAGIYSVYAIKTGATATCDTSVVVQVSVSVNAKPAVQGLTASGAVVVCDGDSVVLSVNSGNKYKWYKNGIPTTDSLNSLVVKQSGTYNAEVTNNAGCSQLMRDTIVTVSLKLNTPIVTGDTTLCAGDTLKLSTNAVTGISFYWTGPDTFTSTSRQIERTQITSAMAGIYKLVAVRAGGKHCDTSLAADVNVSVNAAPTPQSLQVNGSLNLCNNDSVILSINNDSGYTYRWLRNGSNTTGADTLNSLVVKDSGTYNVRVSIGNCSSLMHDTIVSQFPKPITSAVSGPPNVLVSSIQTYSVTNTVGTVYMWVVEGGFIISGNGSSSISIQWNSIPGNGKVKVVETNTNGCKGDTVSLTTVIGNPQLTVNPLTLTYSAVASSKTVTVTSNQAWSASTDQPSWVSLDISSGSSNATVTISLTLNASVTSRTATVTFTAGSLLQTVNITQDAPDLLTIPIDTIRISAASLDTVLLLQSNRSWAITNTATWLSITPASGTGNAILALNIQANTSASPRTTNVTITAGTISRQVHIRQEGAGVGIAETGVVNNISVYPNPSSGIFMFDHKGIHECKVMIHDVTGKLVDSFIANPATISVLDYTSLQNGIYMMYIESEDAWQYLRLVISK